MQKDHQNYLPSRKYSLSAACNARIDARSERVFARTRDCFKHGFTLGGCRQFQWIEGVWMKAMSFKHGFTQLPNRVLKDKRLSFGARLTYAVLLSYAWGKESCFPGQNKMAEDLGISARSIRTYLNELKEHGYISWKYQGPNKPNIYYLPNLKP